MTSSLRTDNQVCRFSIAVSYRDALTCGHASCLTSCHLRFVSNSCHFLKPIRDRAVTRQPTTFNVQCGAAALRHCDSARLELAVVDILPRRAVHTFGERPLLGCKAVQVECHRVSYAIAVLDGVGRNPDLQAAADQKAGASDRESPPTNPACRAESGCLGVSTAALCR